MYENELAHHIAEQDTVDESTFCIGCGGLVYLHDRGTYETCLGGVMCEDCVADDYIADAPAIDAEVMAFKDWREHWTVQDGKLVTT